MENDKLRRFNAFRRICLKNSEDAYFAAELLATKNLNHLVYHLCILSLEEIGKIFMTWIKLGQKEEWGSADTKIVMDDHVKKIFYAVWGPSIGNELITKQQLVDYQFMASSLHERRLVYLYGDIMDKTESSLKIDQDEVESILRFTKARIELAKSDGEVNEEPAEQPDYVWFEKFIEYPDKHDYAFGKEAQEKLIELGEVNTWITWLKEKFEEERNFFQELAEIEFKKEPVKKINEIKPKWEISFTIKTPSHSIRPGLLNKTNKFDRPMKLFPGKDKHTLIIKNLIGNNVTVHSLWQDGWTTSQLFVAALNVGANGIFYWHVPKDIDRYYDTIMDLENKQKLSLRLATRLEFDWREKAMFLTEQNIHLSFLTYEYFLKIRNKSESAAIAKYLRGLGMLAKTDIHLRLEYSALDVFYMAFFEMLNVHEILAAETDVKTIGFSQIDGLSNDKEAFEKIIDLAELISKNQPLKQPVTLTEVLAMKYYCELYFLTIAVRHHKKDKKLKLIGSKE